MSELQLFSLVLCFPSHSPAHFRPSISSLDNLSTPESSLVPGLALHTRTERMHVQCTCCAPHAQFADSSKQTKKTYLHSFFIFFWSLLLCSWSIACQSIPCCTEETRERAAWPFSMHSHLLVRSTRPAGKRRFVVLSKEVCSNISSTGAFFLFTAALSAVYANDSHWTAVCSPSPLFSSSWILIYNVFCILGAFTLRTLNVVHFSWIVLFYLAWLINHYGSLTN